jgi:hypothetical protein
MSKTSRRPERRAQTARPGRTELIQVRLTADEKAGFAAAAILDGKAMSEWLRDRLRRDARQELAAHGQEVPFLPVHGQGVA